MTDSKYRILIVDDDQDTLNFFKLRLEKSGYEVSLAHNANEFEELAFEQKIDLIILDIMLGDQNGAIVYDNLIGRGLDRHIPVIFLSALASDRPESNAYPGRSYALHGKPFEPEKLMKEIKQLLSNRPK